MGEREPSPPNHYIDTEYSTTIKHVQANEADCTFCSYLWSFLSFEDSASPNVKYTARLAKLNFELITPVGMNAFWLSLDPAANGPRAWAIRLNAFTTADDKAANYVTARPLQQIVSPEATQSQIKNWIRQCQDHECCPRQVNVEFPTRLIDISHPEHPDTPRIIESKGRVGRYATLSYVWGSHRKCHLTTSNIRSYMQRLDMQMLPQTIRDAISVARTIPVRYLWVDALCILQDSEDDKAIEIAKMEQIYQNALVVIVAACSGDVSSGFLQPRQSQHNDGCSRSGRTWKVPFRIEEGEFGTMELGCLDCDHEYSEDKEPINKRGWTLQEQLLAPRTLTYASHTLQWRCKAGTRNLGDSIHNEYAQTEAWSSSMTTLSKATPEPHDAILRWMKIVDLYSSRSISLPHDKLPGLAGIANQFISILGPNYYAGVWHSFFLWQLCWQTYTDKWSRAAPVSTYRAPSWSWAALDGPIEFIHDFELNIIEECKPLCEFIEAETTLRYNESPHGEITNGAVTLKGKLRQGWLIRSKRSFRGPRTVVWTTNEDSSLASAEAKYGEWEKEDEQREAREENRWSATKSPWVGAQFDVIGECPPTLVTCLPLFEDFGLLLLPNEQGTYVRIGSFKQFSLCDFESLPQVEITII